MHVISNSTVVKHSPLGVRGSREKILSSVKQSQPAFVEVPVIENFVQPFTNVVENIKPFCNQSVVKYMK